ncbi:MAG: thiamine pyrophosphate-binding protein, partial [Legionella sp.]
TNNKILGIALGTSGPGATNLITGISDCWLDNIPCLFFTGQVNTHESKGDKKIKQQGFQELDIVTIVSSITKYAKKISNVNELLPEINKAIDIAQEGRPGPVLLDIPMNIQREVLDENQLNSLLSNSINCKETCIIDLYYEVATISNEILSAKKPLVLLGGGAVNDDLLPDFLEKLHLLDVPYVASLKGCENIIKTRNYFGMIGSYGKRVANYALQNCDLLVVLGSRLDVRQTGSDCDDFARNARIIQIDIDEHQLNNRIKADKSLHMDTHNFYKEFIKLESETTRHCDWINLLIDKEQSFHFNEYKEFELNPFDIFNLVNEKFKGVSVQFVCDVGNNQMWAAHSIELDKNQKMHHSGGLGAMGFAIPTSIGVQLASAAPVVSFSGDGGAHLNIQEIDIIARENLPILTIVLNNRALGMVKNFQDMYFDGRNDSTYWESYSCDFVQIGKGYNLKSKKIKKLDELGLAIDEFIHNPQPMLLEIDIDSVRECRPRLSFGDRLDNQSPKLVEVHNYD